jgi:hypothetical protein
MEYWNGGTMEFWLSKADYGLILFSEPCLSDKIDIIPPEACLQHSIAPLFHHSTAYEYSTANLP